MPDTGFIFPTAVVNDAAKGTISWGAPTNAEVSDDTFATAALLAINDETNWLRGAFDFAPTLPAGATILGIEVRCERFASTAGSEDLDVQLHDGSAFVGTAKAPASAIPLVDTQESFGGATDLWGTTLTAQQIRAAFQFGYRALRNAVGVSAIAADSLSAKIFYAGVAPGGPAIRHGAGAGLGFGDD